jgi:peptidoglycan/xylan/chitin deacetylase (PgdA/CDA1 family)
MAWKTHELEKRVSCACLICFFIMLSLGSFLATLCAAEASGSNRKVCLFFDDGWQNQYDVAFPILKTYGFKASFAIITSSIGKDRGTFASRINVTELKELQAYGMDIASHSKTHPHMINLTCSQLYDEIVDSKNVLTQMGFNVKTFVYPFGEWNATIEDYVKNAGYVCAREAKPGVYNLKDPDPNAKYQISSWQITNQTMEHFKQILSNATEDQAVVLTYHFLTDNASKSTYIPIQNFREQMQYLKENNFEVVLLPDLFATSEEPLWMSPYFVVAVIGAALATIFICSLIRLRARFKGTLSRLRRHNDSSRNLFL